MPLTSGARLGPYEILAPLGAGGMGEVYRARDTRLKREVALKVLPSHYSADVDRLKRFEQEAESASALNHPNILAIYDIGMQDGSPYIVSELLEGETLRGRLAGGALTPRRAVGHALQIAQGLAAAHEKGIVHRDLKPENVFVTNDGRVKILDFGLAKLTQPEMAGAGQTNLPTVTPGTEPGVVMGTLGYMSPEQVRGKPADARSDIFAFGAILYEMLSGRRAFHGDTAADTISAILTREPPDLSETNRRIPESLDRLVRHCLEKNPESRFHSASDIAFDLEAISGSSGVATVSTAGVSSRRAPRRAFWPVIVALALVGGLVAGILLERRSNRSQPPSFRQLTFRRGLISNARFGPDGQSVFYSASWGGSPFELFSASLNTPQSTSLGLTNAHLAATRPGEAAVLLQERTLAVAPLAGGPARPVLEGVFNADWIRDGSKFAIHRRIGGTERIEFPVGKILYATGGSLQNPRISPRGDLIAFFDVPVARDNRAFVTVVDLAGHKRALTGLWNDVSGLAWSPNGEEIWFSASKSGLNDALYAVSLAGKERLLLRVPGRLVLMDVAVDGRTLVAEGRWRGEMRGVAPGETKERDFSWLDLTDPADISADGKIQIFTEWGEGGGARYSIFLRRTDGSPPVRLGDGWARSLSPDGKWVLAMTAVPPLEAVLVPTGPGEPRVLARGSIAQYAFGGWFPDGKRIILVGNEAGRPVRVFAQAVPDGLPRPLLPEGVEGALVSPDGHWIVARPAQPGSTAALYPVEGGQPKPIPGIAPDDDPIRWSADGSALFLVAQFGFLNTSAQILRLSLATGKKELWRELRPEDTAGVWNVGGNVCITPDGSSFFYRVYREARDLYLVEGLK
jgi:serine/threonine protein kinase